ncbi:MAG TPA: hypothetical protein VIS28_02225 [Nitrososphaeraceae archaeon]
MSSAAFAAILKIMIFLTFLSQSAYSMLSFNVRASLNLILQIVCFRTSDVPINNLAYFFLSLTLFVWYSDACIGKIN